MENKRKDLIIIIILLVMAILGLFAYICYDKGVFIKNEKSDNSIGDKEVQNDVNENKYLGKYILDSCFEDNLESQCTDIFGSSLDLSDNSINILENNKYVLSVGTSILENGVYEIKNNELLLKLKNNNSYIGTISNEKIDIVINNGEYENIKISFKLKTEEEDTFEKNLVGIYNLHSCKEDGNEISCKDLFGSAVSQTVNKIELLNDNRFNLYVGVLVEEQGTYKFVSKTLKFLSDSGYKMIGIVENDKIVLGLNTEEYLNQNIELTFSK